MKRKINPRVRPRHKQEKVRLPVARVSLQDRALMKRHIAEGKPSAT